MNKDILKIIGQQAFPNSDTIDILFDIANTKSNKRQRIECGGILATIVECYQYGVIVGKRQERARHEKCNIEPSKCKLY